MGDLERFSKLYFGKKLACENNRNCDFIYVGAVNIDVEIENGTIVSYSAILRIDWNWDFGDGISIPFDFGINPNLSNVEEMLVLFYWDGISSIVQDVDYFIWGNTNEGVDKTGIEEYFPDTPTSEQTPFERVLIHDFNL